MELAPADTEEVRAAWQAAAEGALTEEKERRSFDSIPEQFLLLVACRDEKQQVELLQRIHDEGIQKGPHLLSRHNYGSGSVPFVPPPSIPPFWRGSVFRRSPLFRSRHFGGIDGGIRYFIVQPCPDPAILAGSRRGAGRD